MKKNLRKFVALLSVVTLLLSTFVFAGCFLLPEEPEQPTQPTKNVVSGADFSANKSYVKWHGRYEVKTAGTAQVALYNTATGFTVDFYGEELSVTFVHSGNDIYYEYALDDEVLPTTNPDRSFCIPKAEDTSSVTIVEGLQKGRHTVTCLKRSEPRDGYTAISEFKTDGGFYERNATKDSSKTKVMVVCASNGSGFGSLYYSPTNDHTVRTTANSSSLLSFMYLTARMLDADVQYVAQAGWTLCTEPERNVLGVLDYTGITQSNSITGAKTTAQWDYSKWTPDIILFHIGGNDTKKDTFDETFYRQSVIEIVQKLHTKYPAAKMLWTHSGTKCGTYAIDELTLQGIIAQGYIKECVIPAIGSDGWGADEHASLKTHIQASDNVTNALEQYFGFTREYRNISFDDYFGLLQK